MSDIKKKKKKIISKKKTKKPIHRVKKKNAKKSVINRFKTIIKNIKKYINKTKKKMNKRKVLNKKNSTSLGKRREEIEELSKIQEEFDNKRTLNKEELKLGKRNLIFKIMLFFIVIAFISSFVVLILTDKDDNVVEELNEISFSKYQELLKSKELSYVYITEDNCTYCELLNPYIFKLQTEYNVEFKTLNISKLSNSEITKLKSSNSTFVDGWEAPLLLSIKGGSEIATVKGYKEYQVLKKFVEYSKNPSDNTSFIKISVNKYLDILKSSDLSVIYIGRSNSKSCEMFAPILEEVSVEEDLKVYYLNTDNIDTSGEWDKITNSNKIFTKNWFVPTVLITKNGEILNYKMESMNKDELLRFLMKGKVLVK